MNTDVYKTVIPLAPGERLYLMVPSGTDITKLPDDIITKTGKLLFFKNILLVPGKLRIALDQDEAIKNLKKQGYHLQVAKIVVPAGRR
ncbi:YcgL domain-containing protein [Desulfococcaceae bacterium HSG8]|nr:YcgL domain-containing protein [Desulfococcaceae bacterium HSG8]